MTKTISTDNGRASVASRTAPATARRIRPLDVLVLSAWCGLAAGLLEVGARVVSARIDSTNRLYGMSRHFFWLVPTTYLLVFSTFGVIFSIGTRCWPRLAGWLAPRIFCALAFLPMLMVAGRRVYPQAWLVVCLGVASLLVPELERHAAGLRRLLLRTFPILMGLVLVLAGFVFGRDRLKQWRETARPLPSASSPNVLFIVLDTVRADRLSLYGYERRTSPSLERLAKHGFLFEEARATAPWTLPSHASMFTGRWPHELDVQWMAPLGGDHPTLAEFLGSRGYTTAGIVANQLYCSYDTRLDRGFTHYEDYHLERLGPFRTARLFDLTLRTVAEMASSFSQNNYLGPFRPALESCLDWAMITEKKNAARVNHEFLAWLSDRPEPDRPFFAFLNYFDAHPSYLLPPGVPYRFGLTPRTPAEFQLFERWRDVDRRRLPQHYQALMRDCYDNCVAYLDEQLGRLFDELQRRGVLDRTLVIVTADHGEGLGEHNLYDHGVSLYRHEIRVPLLIVWPEVGHVQGMVREPVSLRDLPATVVDLLGLEAGSPFPGRSLARFWRDSASRDPDLSRSAVYSELEAQNPANPNRLPSLAARAPLLSVAAGEFVYIRNEADGTEELFNEHDDPRELINRAGSDVMQPVLRRMRSQLEQIRSSSNRPAR